jgi:internalin A
MKQGYWNRILAVTLSFVVLLTTFFGCGPKGVTFPDENLEAAIRDVLGKPVGEEIMAAELANITLLEAYGSNITDLSGLEYCTNLVGLVLRDNDISDLSPLAGLAYLQQLNLRGNNISDISSLTSLSNMTELHLWGNNISDISPLAGLINLWWLELWENNISDISPLAGLINLERLSLEGNSISDIWPLVENSGLSLGDIVWLWDNPLNAISTDDYIPKLKQRGVAVDY